MGVNGSVTTAGRSFSGATCRDTAAGNQPGLDVPVLFFVFNRLPEVERVFEAIRQARPSRLYLAGDGPRPERRGEVLKCEAVRRHVTGKIDWPCEVRTFFKDSNAGPRIAIGEAITWFFENEEMGIVLEEDCLPGPEFFPYCEELLEKYRDDERVMHISGTCQLPDLDREDSYFFSRYPRTWGWATWKRAWSGYSLEIDDLESDLRQIKHLFTAPGERNYWERILRRYDAGKIETWDYPWALTIWKRDGLSVYPTVDLVKNIGFTSDAVHTKPWKDYRGWADTEIGELGGIRHPEEVRADDELDCRVFLECYRRPAAPALAFRLASRAARRAFAP
jgi:hypothetical protein